MITPINQTNNVKTSIFYINDYHGKSINMERTVTASNMFDAKYGNRSDVDTFKLSSGDIMIGEEFNTNVLSVMFQKMIGITANSVGNHEFDMQERVGAVLPLINYNLLSCNVKINNKNPWSRNVKSSVIEERNGHKYGIIGASPIDLKKRTKAGIIHKDITVAEDTVAEIQSEADKLIAQGVNKIILLSHLGYSVDKYVAKKTHGIDVILGGHSHDLVLDVKEGNNLLYSKTGEPVIITQAGRDGKNFGILNLEFDENGIIKKAQNNVAYTKNFKSYLPAKHVFDKIFGKVNVYGYVKSAPPPLSKDLTEPNPHAYFIADCMRKDLKSDIAILPASNIRGYFEPGKVDTRTLSDILPFKNKLYRVNYSEKDLVDGFKTAAKSFKNVANKPGIFYASGVEYCVSTSGELLSMKIKEKSGKVTVVDIDNPREDKYYDTIINDYCAQGNDGFSSMNRPGNIVEKYEFTAIDCVIRTLDKLRYEPVDIYDDGRIRVLPG